MGISIAVFSGFAVALVAPWLTRLTGRSAGWVLALLPAGVTAYLLSLTTGVAAGTPVRASFAWVPGLDVEMAFYADGLALFFALVVTGIGTLIFIYGGGYLRGHHHLGRFFAYLSMFMASMVGLVLADNLLTFYIFFELTSFASFVLIGFNHRSEGSRRAAWQALLVTKGGGLAMLAGFILIQQVTGTMTISEIITQGEVLQESNLYVPILLLVLAGAFTKSAQFPFYFWLPNAMQAPTPVSAYLHSATMVKAGIYVLARFSPALGGTDLWVYVVTATGAVTMLLSAWLALQYTDMKSILAYTTIMALGLLTMLLGMGGETATKAFVIFVLVHAFYKAALFMVAGAVDHGVHERDVTKLGGLRKAMPWTTGAACVAVLSMAGIPPLFGFVGKEAVYEAALHFEVGFLALVAVSVLANVALVAAAGILVIRPFFGPKTEVTEKAHAASPSLWLGPVVLAVLSVSLGLAPWLVEKSFLAPAVAAIVGAPVDVYLALWHGFNVALLLSVITVGLGVATYFLWHRMRRLSVMQGFEAVFGTGLDRSYDRVIDGILAFGTWQTRLFQNGILRYYMASVVGVTVVLAGGTLLREQLVAVPIDFSGTRLFDWVIAGLIMGGSLAAVVLRSRLAAIAAVGVGGFSIALLYLSFGAPDVAMTQFLVETLTVILVVLVLVQLPRFKESPSAGGRLRDALVAVGAGLVVTVTMLGVLRLPFENPMGEYYAQQSYVAAEGQNIVNTILVDFRALDTLGEITVLLVAAFGIFALLKMRAPAGDASSERSRRRASEQTEPVENLT